jgi:ribokinase
VSQRDVEVVVVGSANIDLLVPVPHLPRPGETVLGGDHLRAPGGKGANQAVASARLDRGTALVARIGDDELGRTVLASLVDADVDTSAVRVTTGSPTGLALITVDPGGENAIAVSPGANARLTPGDIEVMGGLLAEATVTLLQLEVDVEVVATAARLAGGTVVLNPAPVPADPLPAELLEHVDVLVPNRAELGHLAGCDEPTDTQAALAAVDRLPDHLDVVVTLGAEGALVRPHGGDVVHVPAIRVDAVDTTGAGDAFCGALADGLARGLPLEACVRWAVRVAGLATTRRGAQPAMPTAAEVRDRS